MRPAVFLDSGFLIALEAKDDQHHRAASSQWSSLAGDWPPIVTTTWVVDEVATFLNRRGRHEAAVRVGEALIRSDWIELVPVDEGLFLEAWDDFARHGDKTYSLTDCVSFVLRRRLGLRIALTFDHHFTQAGFERAP